MYYKVIRLMVCILQTHKMLDPLTRHSNIISPYLSNSVERHRQPLAMTTDVRDAFNLVSGIHEPRLSQSGLMG